MAILETLATKLVVDLIKTIGTAGIQTFFGSKYNDYEKELINVIEKTVEEYKLNHNIKLLDKSAFYDSKIIIHELLKFRFTKQLNIDDIQKNIGDNEKVQMPTKAEISTFLELFTTNIENSENLKDLNIKNNYQEEIFSITEKLDKLNDKIASEFIAIKNQISQFPIEASLSDEWSRQLDEISENMAVFKPKTALERLENLEERIVKKGISIDGQLEGRLSFLKASCMTELGNDEIKGPQTGLYIKASGLCPNNVEFKVHAAMSYYVLDEREKSDRAANEILLKEEFHPGGWLTKCYLSEDNIFQFLNSVPKNVRENKIFKRSLSHWLAAKKKVTEVIEIDNLGLGFDLETENLPEKITSRNKSYWTLVINYLLIKLYNEYPTVGSTGPDYEMFKDTKFSYLKNLLERIVKAIQGTEVEEKHSLHKFLYLYFQFMELGDIKGVSEIEKAFLSIKSRGFAEYIQMVQVLNSLKKEQETKRAIQLVYEFGEAQHEVLCLFNSFNNLEIKDIEASLKSFKNFLSHNKVIDEKAFFNIFEYTKLILHVQPDKLVEVNKLVFEQEFKNESIKALYMLLRPEKSDNEIDRNKIKIGIDKITLEIPNTDLRMRYFTALAYYNNGFFDEAAAYLTGVIEKSQPSHELKLYCLAVYHGNSNKVELLEILGNCRKNGVKDYDLIAMEITLRQTLKDWIKVLEVTKYGLKWYPESERLLYSLFYTYERQTDVESIKQDAHLIKDRIFQDEVLGINLAGILQRAGLHEESIKILYEISSKTQSIQIRQSYFMSTAMFPSGMLKDFTRVEVGSYVKYTYQDNVNIVQVTEASKKSLPGSALLGKTVGEKFMWKLPMSDVFAEGVIVRIMNKYVALVEEIMLDSENPAKGYEMKPMKIEGEFDVKKFHEKLVSEFGYQGSSNKNKTEEILQQYYTGEVSFTEVCKSVFNENNIEAYYYLTQQGKLFKGISSALSPQVVMNDETKYVLDFTAICLFYDLSQELDLDYSHKFIISAYVKTELDKSIEKTKLLPEESLSMEVTMEGVKGHRYEKGYAQKRLDFLTKLKAWVIENCEVDTVDEKLNLLGTSNKDLINDEHIIYMADNRLLTERSNCILLTNDIAYYRHFKGNTSDIVSPELYLKKYFPTKATEFANYMLNQNYVGIELTQDILQDQFVNMLSGKSNRFSICQENLNLSWNPHLSHIESTVQFLKWLYLTSFISMEVKRPAAFTLLFLIIRGANKIQMDRLRNSLKSNFKLMGTYDDEIQIILLEALKSVGRRN